MRQRDGLPTCRSVGVRILRGPIGPKRVAIASTLEHPEVVVVGVIFHHQDDDVLDLGEGVGGAIQRWLGLTRSTRVPLHPSLRQYSLNPPEHVASLAAAAVNCRA